jgi:hypothetical protein
MTVCSSLPESVSRNFKEVLIRRCSLKFNLWRLRLVSPVERWIAICLDFAGNLWDSSKRERNLLVSQGAYEVITCSH